MPIAGRLNYQSINRSIPKHLAIHASLHAHLHEYNTEHYMHMEVVYKLQVLPSWDLLYHCG